jgi:general secretion pathway protein B
MSYILDALRQADAQRERGAVPGLHAQAMPVSQTPTQSPRRPWLWALAGLLLAVSGLLAGWWATRPAPAATPAVAGPVPTAPVPAVSPAPPFVASAVPQAPPALPAPGVRPPPAPPAVSAVLALPQMALPQMAARPSAVPDGPARPPPPADTGPASHAVTPEREAAAGVSQALPRLAISGSTWSDNPAYRMLVINGQVFQEGQEPAPGVVLEQIGPKAAVLRYRGQRHTLAY